MAGSKQKEDGKLPFWAAIWNALFNKDISFYPRLAIEGKARSLDSYGIIMAVAPEAAKWTSALDDAALEKAAKLARESLDEVKALTEYQDQKATRLLTVTTFLSALSGALFLRFNDSYPLKPAIEAQDIRLWLLVPAYLAFCLFALAAVSGALVTFHATRTRFKYPQPSLVDPAKQDRDPKSQLFYQPIIEVNPAAWARAFVNDEAGGKAKIRADLQRRYLQSYVTESYLVAAKAADKLRYLQPAQFLLSVANTCLLVWLVLLGIVNVSIAPTRKADPPVAVRVENLPTPLPVTLTPPQPAESNAAAPPANAPAPTPHPAMSAPALAAGTAR